VQRVEKTLQDAGIKLSSVASEVLGVSARLMLDALISGTHDPDVLAELAKGALRKKIPALREALQGRFTGHHALLIGQMLAQIDFLDGSTTATPRPSGSWVAVSFHCASSPSPRRVACCCSCSIAIGSSASRRRAWW